MNWVLGEGGPTRRAFPDVAAVPATWAHGQTRIMVACVCCPHCGSLQVRRNDTADCPGRMECTACTGSSWKMPGIEIERARAIVA